MIGKWHLGMYRESLLPQYRGFDHFLGLYGGSGNFWTHSNCFEPYKKGPKKGRESYTRMCGYDMREAVRDQPGVARFDLNGTHSSDIFTDEVENRLKHWNREKPLFTYLSLQASVSKNTDTRDTDTQISRIQVRSVPYG